MDDEFEEEEEMPILDREEYLETTQFPVISPPAAEGSSESSKNLNEQDYVDNNGISWKFVRKLDLAGNFKKQLRKFWRENFLKRDNHRSREFLIKLKCKLRNLKKNGPKRNGHDCKMAALFRLTDGRLFTSGAHNHPLKEEEVREEAKTPGRAVWPNGFKFLCNAKMSNLHPIARQMGFHLNYNTTMERDRVWLICSKFPRLKCPYRALFVVKRQAIYGVTHLEHNHPIEAKGNSLDDAIKESKNDEEKVIRYMREYDSFYLDRWGKRWSLLAGIEGEKELKEWCKTNWMRMNSKRTRKQLFFACKLSAYFRRKGNKERPGPYCQFRAHFNQMSSRLYVIGEHNHPMGEEVGGKARSGNNRGNEGRMEDDEEMDELLWEKEMGEESESEEEDEESNDESEAEEEMEEMEKEEEDKGEEEEDKGEEEEDKGEEEEDKGEEEEDKGEEEEDKGEEEELRMPLEGGELDIQKGGGEELSIVGEIDRDFKLPHFKKEGEIRPTDWPTVIIDDPEDDWPRYSQLRPAGILPPVKKEEPGEEIDEPQQMPTIPPLAPILPPQREETHQNGGGGQARKMLLRERKRKINYAE